MSRTDHLELLCHSAIPVPCSPLFFVFLPEERSVVGAPSDQSTSCEIAATDRDLSRGDETMLLLPSSAGAKCSNWQTFLYSLRCYRAFLLTKSSLDGAGQPLFDLQASTRAYLQLKLLQVVPPRCL